MKYFPIIFKIKPLFVIFFIISLISSKIYYEETLDDKIKDICLKADSSVKSFFEEKQELPEKYKNLVFSSEVSEKEINSAIKFLLLDEKTINNFIQIKSKQNKYLQIFEVTIIIISFIIIFNFEIHFCLRLCFKENILKPSFTNFYKISPFYWIIYFFLNKEKKSALYKKFLNRNPCKKNKYFIYSFAFIIFAVIGVIFTITLLISKENENSSIVTINVLCTRVKLINEIQNGKQLQKDGTRLIGFNDINLFLNELMESKNLFKNYFNNYTKIENEIKNNLSEWENYLINIQNNLSDKNSLKYFFYNYPSDPKYIEQISCNFSNAKFCKKSLFQTEIIYNYYPYNDSSKTLWAFNNNLHVNINPLLEKLNVFEQSFIKSENSLNFFIENQNLKNGFSKINTINNIYIQYMLEIDNENMFDKFIYSYLSYIYSFDFILLILLGLNTLLALLYVEYYCVKKYFFGRVVISFVFYNIIFMILILSIIEVNMLKKIKLNFSFINEISKGIYYILNNEINYNHLFNEENNTFFQNISLIMQFKNTTMNNNLFNYIKYYINNENEFKNLLNNKILHINKNQLIIINNTLNEFINSTNKISILNNQISNFSEKLLKFTKEGLKHSTTFVDLTSKGFLGSYLEDPLTYLTYVNLITRKSARDNYNYKEDVPCDETWNISIIDYPYDDYYYKSRDLVLCENCINKCSNKKFALNFMEYSIEELEQRYNHLKSENCSDSYYELMYYFNAADKLRDKKIFEQIESLYEVNENLKNIQSNIFNSIKMMGRIAKNITIIYENILNKYEKEKIFFNYTEFIKDDLFYLIGQIELNFSKKISKEFKTHLNINIMCVCICFCLFIFYTLIAKEMKYYKIDNNEEDVSSVRENEEIFQADIRSYIKKDQIKIINRKPTPELSSILNIYIINEKGSLRKNKTLDNNNADNEVYRNKNNTEHVIEKNIGFLDSRKILIRNRFNENAVCSVVIDENRNDESRYDLTKGFVIENKKENVISTINKDSQKYLYSKNRLMRSEMPTDKNIK